MWYQILTMWYHRIMHPKYAYRMANNVDLDHTAPCSDLSVQKQRTIMVAKETLYC